MLLSIVCFLISMIVASFLTNLIVSIPERLVIYRPICLSAMRVAQNYVNVNGRGYFEQPVADALRAETILRTWFFLGFNLVALILAIIFIPSSWSFWVVSPWAIKIGAILGILINAGVDLIASSNTKAHFGRLKFVDESGRGHFEGIWEVDFDIDLSTFASVGYPPADNKYLVLDYCSLSCIAPINT